jgi:hypothetical protein
MKSIFAAVILVASLPLTACQSSNPSGPTRIVYVPVRGRVATDAGAAVAGATVQINSGSHRATGGRCATEERIPVTVVARGDGSFVADLTVGGIIVAWLCVTLNVSPPIGSGLSPGSAVADSVVVPPLRGDTLSFQVTLIKAP